MQTVSKNFTPDEIIGYLMIDGRQVTYLKPHVKRLHRYPETLHEDYMDHLNHGLIALQRYTEYLKKVVGLDDYEKL